MLAIYLMKMAGGADGGGGGVKIMAECAQLLSVNPKILL